MRAGCLLAAVLLCLATAPARAQPTAGVGFQYFNWTEDTQPSLVEEHGPLAILHLGWSQHPSRSLRLAYRSRYYMGWVEYQGSKLFSNGVAASGTSRHLGTMQEGQVRYRLQPTFDVFAAVGVDLWQRKLSLRQREEFQIGYARLGMGSTPAKQEGWIFDAGLKSPLWSRENAHLTDIGFDQNPILKPGVGPSLFGELGYRLNQDWTVVGQYDGFRFRTSNLEPVTVGGNPRTVFQPGGGLQVLGLEFAYRF